MAATAAGTLLLDQAAKAVLAATVPPGVSIDVVPRILALTHVRNTGIAFGLFRGLPPLITVLGALTVVFLLFYNQIRLDARRGQLRAAGRARRPDLVAIGMIAGGALGNVIDRVRLGYVIDYLDLHVWPVFNLADAAVVCGAGWLLVVALWGSRGRDTEPADATAARGDP